MYSIVISLRFVAITGIFFGMVILQEKHRLLDPITALAIMNKFMMEKNKK